MQGQMLFSTVPQTSSRDCVLLTLSSCLIQEKYSVPRHKKVIPISKQASPTRIRERNSF